MCGVWPAKLVVEVRAADIGLCVLVVDHVVRCRRDVLGMQFHPEVPLPPLPRPVHLWIPLPHRVLQGCRYDAYIHDRTFFQHHPRPTAVGGS